MAKRKQDYSGGAYTDIDGMSRQFTIIDHDKKTTISAIVDVEGASQAFKKDREKMIERILALPPSAVPFIFTDFTTRGESIQWNEKMIRDEGLPFDKLRDIEVLTRKRAFPNED
jgi:hypothetical protein